MRWWLRDPCLWREQGSRRRRRGAWLELRLRRIPCVERFRLGYVSDGYKHRGGGDIRDLMYPQTMGAMSRSSFIKPASKSGASYGSGDTMCVSPRENGYSRKWNIVKNFPAGINM